MSPKSQRPNVFGLDHLMVKPAGKPEPEAVPAEPDVRSKTVESATFRTSVYFSRAVHDKLRLIAFEERKSVTDLINEGLDEVLRSRGYPTTAELRGSAKA